jgi:gamma-glutamyl-gamma-aminobutyrate hydrolase PuuD
MLWRQIDGFVVPGSTQIKPYFLSNEQHETTAELMYVSLSLLFSIAFC